MRFSHLVLVLLLATRAGFSVRPFVTDDARISDYGQIELEMWPDYTRESTGEGFGFNGMLGISFTNYLQLITGSGLGTVPGQRNAHWHDWVIQPKVLIKETRADGLPGVAFAAGTVLPLRHGDFFRRDTGYFSAAMSSVRLFNDWLLIHANIGMAGSTAGEAPAYTKFYWGIGFDVGVFYEELRFIGEIFAGDPYEIIGPTVAYQTGFRYLHSDNINFDLTAGMQDEVDNERQKTGATSWWLQVGIRLLFDVFTRDGKPGNPMGASGLLR